MIRPNPKKKKINSKERDEYAIILDFLPRGYTQSKFSYPVAQAIGTKNLTLLELKPKDNVSLTIGEKVYIGEGERDKIQSIVKRLYYRNLTVTAQNELEKAIEDIVENNEKKYVEFYNRAESINIREHQLDLLPGMGKKTLWQIIEERKKKPFTSFEDIKQRIANIPDPKKMIVKRILEEIKGNEKIYLFVRPPTRTLHRRIIRRG